MTWYTYAMGDDSTGTAQAVIAAVRSTPLVSELIYESVNQLASEETVDGMASAAGAEARAVILGLAADIAEGAEPSTTTTAAFFAAVGDVTFVDWTEVGEAVLMDVVTSGTHGG